MAQSCQTFVDCSHCSNSPAASNPDKVTFYDRMNASVLAKLIENVLTTLSVQVLLLQRDLFTFTDATSGEVHFDGPTMLNLILMQIDPDMIVGMDFLKAQLESMKLHDYGKWQQRWQDAYKDARNL